MTCEALQKKNELDIERAASIKLEEKDVNNPLHWRTRSIPMEKFNFEGEPKSGHYPNGTSITAMHSLVHAKLKDLAATLSDQLHDCVNSVSLSMAIDLAVRWFIQHPPTLDWMHGYCNRWMYEHRPGRRVAEEKPKSLEETWINNMDRHMEAGFKSFDDFKTSIESVQKKAIFAKRQAMEDHVLTYNEICPSVPREWIVKGKLKIPKEVREGSARLRENELPADDRHEDPTSGGMRARRRRSRRDLLW